MKKLTKDEQATLSTKVDGDLATCTFTVKPDADSPERYNLTVPFDFKGVSREELIQLAVRPLRIDFQGRWRASKNKMDKSWEDRQSVRNILDGMRTKADPMTRATRAIEKLSKAEREQLMKLLQS